MARNSLIAWWSGLGAFIALPWVQSLLQELRSFKPSGAAKKKKKRKKKRMYIWVKLNHFAIQQIGTTL